jgi:hypothetical protein
MRNGQAVRGLNKNEKLFLFIEKMPLKWDGHHPHGSKVGWAGCFHSPVPPHPWANRTADGFLKFSGAATIPRHSPPMEGTAAPPGA